jgi:acid phosphatase type 7
MKYEGSRQLVDAAIEGRISRRDFVIKALALGMSVSGITAVLATVSTPADAQVTGGTYSLLFSSSSNRSNPASLADKTVSGNIYVFTSPDSGVYQVRFYLDNPNMSGTPRKVEKTAPYDFAGGTVSTANPFNTATVTDGAHTITAAVDLTAGGTEVVHAPFTVSNNSGTVRAPDQVHLAWLGAPSTTLTVVWRTWNTATASTVQYRATGSTTWQQATGAPRTSGTTGKLHQVNLSGLNPSTSYEYRVQGDGGAWSNVYSTRTAPPPGPADFDVIYFADTGLVGREDGLATGTKQVVSEIAAINPLLVLPGGDYAYYDTDKRYGTLENTIDAWFNQVQPIASRSPMMPTYGNHEVLLGEGYLPWANRFPTPKGWNARRAYSFDVGDVHFISVFAVQNFKPLTTEQVSWLENDIATAKAAGRRWIIPYMHVSAFADGKNHPSNLNLRAQLGPIFERNGIKLVLSSHDQAYERTYPLTDIGTTNTPTSTSASCYEMSDGVTWVKISPGGKLSNKNEGFSQFATNPPPAWTAYRNNTTHVFSRLSVRASGSLRLDTYGVKGDGTSPVIIDTFQYTIGGCE